MPTANAIETQKLDIGFIGTGIMGEPMALQFIRAGHRVKVWNRTREKLNALISAGAQACDSPNEAARGVSALVCMFGDGPTIDKVLFQDSPTISAMTPGSLLIVMSSIPIETAKRQAIEAAKFGVRYLDAPVSGGEKGAQAATLAIFVGGAKEDFDAAEPLLRLMGRPTHIGPAGSGELTKLANQLIVATTIAAVSEAMLFAERGGVSPERVREAMFGGWADSPILRQHAQRMIDNDFVPGGTAKFQIKDTRAALGFAQSISLSLPVITLVNSLFEAMVEHGDGELDHSGIIRELRRLNS